MTDRTHSDPNAKVRAIVDDGIAELYLIGMDSRSAAAALMSVQALIRIDDEVELANVVRFAANLIEPDE